MAKKRKDRPSGSRGGSELGATYFPFVGPSPTEIQDTSFCQPPHSGVMTTSSGYSPDRQTASMRREVESLHSSQSEAEDNMVSIPLRPRPFRDPQSLVLVAPPYTQSMYQPGYGRLGPPMIPLVRTASDETYRVRQLKPYQRMPEMGLKHVVIFVGTICLLAFAVTIFVAVYYGRKTNDNSSV